VSVTLLPIFGTLSLDGSDADHGRREGRPGRPHASRSAAGGCSWARRWRPR